MREKRRAVCVLYVVLVIEEEGNIMSRRFLFSVLVG